MEGLPAQRVDCHMTLPPPPPAPPSRFLKHDSAPGVCARHTVGRADMCASSVNVCVCLIWVYLSSSTFLHTPHSSSTRSLRLARPTSFIRIHIFSRRSRTRGDKSQRFTGGRTRMILWYHWYVSSYTGQPGFQTTGTTGPFADIHLWHVALMGSLIGAG